MPTQPPLLADERLLHGAALVAARCLLLAAAAVWNAPPRAFAAGPVEWEESEGSCAGALKRCSAVQACDTKPLRCFCNGVPPLPGVCPPLAHVPADFRAEPGAPLWPGGRGV